MFLKKKKTATCFFQYNQCFLETGFPEKNYLLTVNTPYFLVPFHCLKSSVQREGQYQRDHRVGEGAKGGIAENPESLQWFSNYSFL